MSYSGSLQPRSCRANARKRPQNLANHGSGASTRGKSRLTNLQLNIAHMSADVLFHWVLEATHQEGNQTRLILVARFYLPLRTTRTTRFAAAARYAKPLNPHSLRAPCYMCKMCYMGLTRQAAEPPLSPSSLLYVLYVPYYSARAKICSGCSAACLVRAI